MPTKTGIKEVKKRTMEPNMKVKRLANAVIENTKRKVPLSKSQLLEIAGYSKTTIDATPFRPFTSQGFQVALQRMGATEEKLGKVIAEAMDAKQGAWFKGEHTESEHADHAIRLRAVDQLAELTGAKITKVQVQSVNLSMSTEELMTLLQV